MGLDMYLEKKRYVKNWDHQKKKDRHTITVKKGNKLVKDNMPVSYIVYEAGYWRKANAIHKWFVDNVQHGEDDCKSHYVSIESLKELLELCEEVIKTAKLKKAKVKVGTRFANGKQKDIVEDGEQILNAEEIADILPTGEGFFFGSQDYNNWYINDIKNTIKIIKKCLENNEDEECSFYYQSSW